MRKTILIALIVAIISPSFVFPQWIQISSIGTNELKGVKFFNEHTGIVVGQGGIWRSTNSGINWLQVNSTNNLNAVHFPTENIGYAVGDSGKIFKTTNNGNNWVSLNSTTTQNLLSVHFINQSTGHVGGINGIMLRTQNEGSSFSSQTAIGDDYYDVEMITAGTIYATGSSNYETVITSLSGGTQWSSIYFTSGNGFRSLGLISTTPQHTFICVGINGRIRYTSNAGFNWVTQTSNTSQMLNSAAFVNTSTGYIAGNNGIILKTTNTGSNWLSQTTSTSNNLRAITFINSETGWAVGSNGSVLRIGIPVGIQINNELTSEFILFQNYPNPFNPTTTIKFQLVKDATISLRIYDSNGKLIKILLEANLNKGQYDYVLEAKDLASGIYFYSLSIDNILTSAKKLTIIK